MRSSCCLVLAAAALAAVLLPGPVIADTKIPTQDIAKLEEIARLLQASLNLRLHVVGHTDNQGQLAYNMDLSRRRAQSVVQALVQADAIAAARLIGHGIGPLAPVAPNTDDAGRARNRRTELVPQ